MVDLAPARMETGTELALPPETTRKPEKQLPSDTEKQAAKTATGEPGNSGFLLRGTFWRGPSAGRGAAEGTMQRPELGDGEALGTGEAELRREAATEKGAAKPAGGSCHMWVNAVLHACSGDPTRPGTEQPGEPEDSHSSFGPGSTLIQTSQDGETPGTTRDAEEA